MFSESRLVINGSRESQDTCMRFDSVHLILFLSSHVVDSKQTAALQVLALKNVIGPEIFRVRPVQSPSPMQSERSVSSLELIKFDHCRLRKRIWRHRLLV